MSPALAPRRRLRAGLLAALCLAALPAPAAAAADYPAPDWTLPTVDGGRVRLHGLLGEGPVVVAFWATWCKPCLKELPHLEALAAAHAGRVTFLAVAADDTRSVAKVAPYVAARGFDHLTVPLDTGGDVQRLLQTGGVMPFLVVYDAAGREAYRHVGYKEGDERALAAELDRLLAGTHDGGPAAERPAWAEAVTATDRFEYSYSTRTRREIVDNWLDVAYRFGGFTTGIMLRSEAPGEQGQRASDVRHRWFAFDAGAVSLRAGHFYGTFGRGLVLNAYEDRTVRVDTRLDGVLARWQGGRGSVAVLTGSPAARALDVRGADAQWRGPAGLRLGASGLTWRPDAWVGAGDEVRREWVAAARLEQRLPFGDWYLEHGRKKGWDFVQGDDAYAMGSALYANVNLYAGPVSLSWEHSDYERFTVIPGADGTTPLNRPPSLTRDFTWTLMNRAPHPLDADDEQGDNLDLLLGAGGWNALVSGVRLRDQAGATVYELAWASLQAPRAGDLRLTGGFGYQDREGLRQTAVAEAVWYLDERRSLTLQAEHQHARPDLVPGRDEGAYDEEFVSLEFKAAPSWALAAILEVNNKYDEQRAPDEQPGPFPAGQVTYTLARGGDVNLWFGKRQAGYLCSGGVCKFEPAFEGVEVFGTVRY